jgi:hypothetical protein
MHKSMCGFNIFSSLASVHSSVILSVTLLVVCVPESSKQMYLFATWHSKLNYSFPNSQTEQKELERTNDDGEGGDTFSPVELKRLERRMSHGAVPASSSAAAGASRGRNSGRYRISERVCDAVYSVHVCMCVCVYVCFCGAIRASMLSFKSDGNDCLILMGSFLFRVLYFVSPPILFSIKFSIANGRRISTGEDHRDASQLDAVELWKSSVHSAAKWTAENSHGHQPDEVILRGCRDMFE